MSKEKTFLVNKMSSDYQLRPATMDDIAFMMRLEKENFAQLPEVWVLFDEARQKDQYEHFFRPNHVSIIEYKSHPIGAVSIITRRKDIFIVYLYLLPEFHDSGIDVSLIKEVLEQAKQEQKPVITCMFKAEQWEKSICNRLGFTIFNEYELRWRVKWNPP